MKKLGENNIKRYVISALVSFLAGFAIVILADINSITLESIKNGSIAGLIFVAIRTGIKGMLEYILSVIK